MRYKLYTLVDITFPKSKTLNDLEKSQLQNFNTLIQTLGLRSNVYYHTSPIVFQSKGSLLGFNTEEITNIWRFDFDTEHQDVYKHLDSDIGLLISDFEMVPFIPGLNESIKQNYPVFVTQGPNKNIIFQKFK